MRSVTYDDLISHYKTESDAARAIDVPRQTVHRWKKAGVVPLEQQVKYEVASNGNLRADLPDSIREGHVAA